MVLLVALSTLFTKQHYVADLVGGVLLASAAYALFLRGYPRSAVPARDRTVAPALGLCVAGIVSLGVLGFWMMYRMHLLKDTA